MTARDRVQGLQKTTSRGLRRVLAATTGLGLLIAEKVWLKNKLGAVLGMVAANAITTVAVINNYGVIRKLERR